MSVKKAPRIPLPKAWAKHVRWAMPHVISLAQYARASNRHDMVLSESTGASP